MTPPSIRRFLSVRFSGLPPEVWVDVLAGIALEINLKRGVSDGYDPRAVNPFAVKKAIETLAPEFVLVLAAPQDLMPSSESASPELLQQMEAAWKAGCRLPPVVINSRRPTMLMAGHKRAYSAIQAGVVEIQAVDLAQLDLEPIDRWLHTEESLQEESQERLHFDFDWDW